jgi:hypothetical protein
MQIIEKDITTIDHGIIVHQVNCQGAMGSGVAKAIRAKWPLVFDEYLSKWKTTYFLNEDLSVLLGEMQPVQVSGSLYVVNLFGQNEYKRPADAKIRHTSYAAWEKALPKLKGFADQKLLPVYFPYLAGCDRGGGDWRIISAMIEEHLPDAIFCKYNGD